MAAATDKLMEVGIATATTLDANYTINDTSITVASTSGWPTATGVAFAIDVVDSNGVQVPGTYNEYVGVVSSATSITSVDHVNGTDRNYSAGATTRVYIPVSAERENRIVEWGVVQHKQDGTHADTITTNTINENTPANGVTIDGLNIKDGALTTANSIPTTAIQDGAVTPNKLLATTGSSWVWQDWTPTWTNLTVGNGTVVAKYTQIGKTVFFRLHFTYGTTSSISGLIGFTPPVTSIASTLQRDIIGNVLFDDTGLSNTIGFACFLGNTNRIDCFVTTASGTYASLAGSSATVPITFANGDTISVNGSYQGA